MLSKILKFMLIIILLPLFAYCSVITIGVGSSVATGVSDGYNERKEASE